MKKIIIAIMFVFALACLKNINVYSSENIGLSPSISEVFLGKNDGEKKIEITIFNNTKFDTAFAPNVQSVKQDSKTGKAKIDTLSSNDPNMISLPERIEVPKNSSKKISVVIKNLPSMKPKGYYRAIVFKAVSTNDSKNIETNYGIASTLFIVKEGSPLKELNIVKSTVPENKLILDIPKNIDLTIQNDSSIHMVPYGNITVYDQFKSIVATGTINKSSSIIFPDNQRTISVPMSNVGRNIPLPIGVYTISISGHDAKNVSFYGKVYKCYFINILSFIIFSIIFAILSFLIKKIVLSILSKKNVNLISKVQQKT